MATWLVVATGTSIQPGKTEGVLDGGGWRENVYDFYNPDGAAELAGFLKFWKRGRMVVNVAEMPIKCPVALLEFLFNDHFPGERSQGEIEKNVQRSRK